MRPTQTFGSYLMRRRVGVVDQDQKATHEVAARLLHDYSRSLGAGDYDLYRGSFHLPCLVDVSGTARIISSESELKRAYEAIRKYCKMHGVKDVVSTMVGVEQLTPKRLSLTGVLCLTKDKQVRLSSPFPVYLIADQIASSWRISCSIYCLVNAPDLTAALEAKRA